MKPLVPGLLVTLVLTAGCVRATDAPPAAQPAPDLTAVVKGDNQFAFDLYARLRGQEGNLFFSPYSISAALAMTANGARGETRAQMIKTLHLPDDPERFNPALAALIKQINGEGRKRGYELSTANALWGQKGYPFVPAFLDLLKKDYGAGLREVPFSSDPEASRQTINAWVEKETKERIKDLLQQGALSTDTRLVLTNAIYFKGDWARQFEKQATRAHPFYLSTDKKVSAPLMYQQSEYGLFQDDAVQVLRLPYVGKELEMIVLLPKKKDGVADLEKSLSVTRLDTWLKGTHPREVDVFLPRFTTTVKFQLNKVLSELGMPLAFTRRADFSGMNSGQEKLYIGAVVHKAFVLVNEQGTEAAAATAVEVKAESAQIIPVFRADHPFVFLIRDTRSGSILFLGRLSDPR